MNAKTIAILAARALVIGSVVLTADYIAGKVIAQVAK